MKRVLIILAITTLMMLSACETKTTGKRVAIPDKIESSNSITGNTIVDTPVDETGETGKTAAEALKELQQMEEITTTASGTKSGTFYPPVTTDATGEAALKERTRALFSKPVYDPNVEADDEFGAKYHDDDGDVKNLPDEYSDNDGD